MLYVFLLVWAILGTLYQLFVMLEYHAYLVHFGKVKLSLEFYLWMPLAITGQVLFIWVS